MLVSFFDGLVPCLRWAITLRRSGQSACVGSHTGREVKGSLAFPEVMSETDTAFTTEFSVALTNWQIWHLGSSQAGALREAKSDGRLAVPRR